MLAAASAAIDDFAGGTRLGESLASCASSHARRLVGRRTLVLVITDGLDTGEPEELARELDWLAPAAGACCGSTRCCVSRATRRWRAARPCCTAMRTACWRSTISASWKNWRPAWRPSMKR